MTDPVVALVADHAGFELKNDCLRTFLDTPFAGGRHARRVAKLSPSQP